MDVFWTRLHWAGAALVGRGIWKQRNFSELFGIQSINYLVSNKDELCDFEVSNEMKCLKL
jgi:hypothetical protein